MIERQRYATAKRQRTVPPRTDRLQHADGGKAAARRQRLLLIMRSSAKPSANSTSSERTSTPRRCAHQQRRQPGSELHGRTQQQHLNIPAIELRKPITEAPRWPTTSRCPPLSGGERLLTPHVVGREFANPGRTLSPTEPGNVRTRHAVSSTVLKSAGKITSSNSTSSE